MTGISMRLVKNQAGRVTIIYIQDEVLPEGGYYFSELIRLFGERYSFQKIPTLEEAKQETKFEGGVARIEDGLINIHQLLFYNDGISVLASDTDSALEVLRDAIDWTQSVLGFRKPLTPPYYVYENHAVVDFERQMSELVKAFSIMKASFDAAARRVYSHPFDSHFIGLRIGVDPAEARKAPKVPFEITRRDGFPYSENRFFCTAPLPTDEHMALLVLLDESLGALN